MARRLRIGIAVILAMAIATPVAANSFASCWVVEEFDPVYAAYTTITRCRIVGGDTVDYASDSDVPSVLYTNLGTDLTGECWYLTSASTSYIILVQYADGSADIGFDTDPTTPGGIVAIGPTIPRCTSEPAPASDPVAEAWAYVMSYVHDPPQPELSPVPGQGITGIDTYLGLPVPDDHSATLASGTSSLEVEIVVDAVVVAWGDGSIDTYPADDTILAGYPDGGAIHVYEVKNTDGAALTVEYDWTARWRLVGGTWTPLDVPNTATTIGYPVAEVVSRLGD